MRLLSTNGDGEFSLTEFIDDSIPRYAILSHTWGADQEEVAFKDMMEKTGRNKRGYGKLQFCRERAAGDHLDYFWVDTCCIDKSSSTELSEAINSMFRWYREAAKCYVYLSDVSTSGSIQTGPPSQLAWEAAFQQSRWFTRGWTLQELLAPASVEFYSTDGKLLGDKTSMVRVLQEITGISGRALQGDPLSGFGVDERLSWAAGRKTKRAEDAAYSLLGIFDIHMPLIYGEGKDKALARLQREMQSLQGEGSRSGIAHSYNGPVFNGAISGRYVIPGPQATGGTMNFNFGGDGQR
ncbi:HET-domain-containing protein [Polyplosphaeria fusca]|uniref:HET-domain-containing protein n=1 Tax=Polyplosphaeria fusca TaxID=682080 RepID=A0A9P4QX78_9PLEO|nr:HET-domain-containing protein [Polyplosphaeria fusca]